MVWLAIMSPSPPPPTSSSSHKIRIVRPGGGAGSASGSSAATASPTPTPSGTPSLKIKLSNKRPRGDGEGVGSHHANAAGPSSSPPPPPASSSASTPIRRRKRVPIRDALSRLVAQMIKRDAYAIFTQPVDESQVPGYRTIIQHPMDLGTMSGKVQRDEYPRVDQFKFDFLLVTGNAKVFNLPDSFYHVQAQKLEDWGLKAIEAAEAKGIRQHGDEPSPDPEPAPRPALTPIQMAQLSHASSSGSASPVDAPSHSTSSSTGVKRLSIKLKRPPSMGGGGASSNGSASPPAPRKKAKKSHRDSPSSERKASRPLVSSSLSRPPMLADSPSPASSDDEGVSRRQAMPASSDDSGDDNDDGRGDSASGSSESGSQGSDSDSDGDSDGDSSDEDSTSPSRHHDPYATSSSRHAASSHRVKTENDSDEEMEDASDDSDGESRSRTAASFRDSETPMPGGVPGSRKKQPPAYVIKPKVQQKRNAPIKVEESASAAIEKIMADAKAKGLPMTVSDAALEYRQTIRRNQPTKSLAYTLDGSLDLDQLRAAERADILASLGYLVDEATGAPIADDGMPELTATYPLHPDAQKHLDKLARSVPSDLLGIATNVDVRPRETTGSHYEHGLPSGHRRIPVSVPTAYAAVPRPQGPDGAFIPGEGLAQPHPSDLPYSWPHPLRSTGKDYEPPAQMDPLYPASTGDPAANRPKYRNKDFERENEGQANLRDWTYPHVSYSRLWDGSGDLAVWKEMDGALRSAGFGAGEAFQRWEESRALRFREMINAEEKQAVHICTDKAVRADDASRRGGKADDDDVTKPLPDDESELGLLHKMLQLDKELTLSQAALAGTEHKTHAALLPGERVRHTINGADFLTRELWGEATIPGIRPGHVGLAPIAVPGGVADGEMWARSVQSFIEGAVGGLAEDESDEGDEGEDGGQGVQDDKEAVTNGPAVGAANNATKSSATANGGFVTNGEAHIESNGAAANGVTVKTETPGETSRASPSPTPTPPPPPPPRTPHELLVNAHAQGLILDRPLFEYVRDEVVAPQTHFRSLTTLALLGESLRKFEQQRGDVIRNGEDGGDDDGEDASSRGSSPPPSTAPPLPPALTAINPESTAWVLLLLPLLWSSSSYLKRLWEAPMHIDTEHLMRKREDWMQPRVPAEYATRQPPAGQQWPMRMEEEKDWTSARIGAALQQYGEILVDLNGRIRAHKANDEDTAKMKDYLRLALLAISRLAPGWAIKVSRR